MLDSHNAQVSRVLVARGWLALRQSSTFPFPGHECNKEMLKVFEATLNNAITLCSLHAWTL